MQPITHPQDFDAFPLILRASLVKVLPRQWLEKGGVEGGIVDIGNSLFILIFCDCGTCMLLSFVLDMS